MLFDLLFRSVPLAIGTTCSSVTLGDGHEEAEEGQQLRVQRRKLRLGEGNLGESRGI